MTQLTIITDQELQSASTVLATTKTWVAAYQKKHDALLEMATKEGVKLSKTTDQAINDYLASLKLAAKKAEEDRKPFTQKMDEVKKLFTFEENKLKNELSEKLQAKRDASVKQYAIEDAAERQKEQLALSKEKARVEMFAEAENQIRTAYGNLLANDKGLLMSAFEGATLENFEQVSEMFTSVIGTLEESVWDGINANLNGITGGEVIKDELESICIKAKEGKLDKVSPHYKSEIKAYADYLLSLLPSRKLELEQGLESETASRLKKEQDEANEAIAKQAELDAAKKLQENVANVVIDSQITTAKRLHDAPNAQSIESYSIVVKDRSGWAEIFKFYFTNSTEQDLGKIKLDQMKAFAEKEAKKTGEMISSNVIHYEPTYKAVVKSKKSA